jgi:GT2 family glycosyltransferase
MKEISILFPSLREKLAIKRLSEWEATNFDVDFEVILVSPFEVQGGKITWIKDVPPFRGSVQATNQACNIAQGKYVIYMSDDVKPTKKCLQNMINFMNEQKTHPFLGAFKMINSNGKAIGPFGVYNRFYSCYGCISKDDLMSLNGILFKPQFKYSWADCDLSLRVWNKQGEVKICNDAIVIPEQENDDIYKEHRKLYWKQDVNTFLDIWHSRLGKGIERNDGDVNKKLKGE